MVFQYLHRLDISISRKFEGKENNVFVGEMEEERAIKLASNFISEGFVYTTAVILVLLEQKRKRDDEALKKKHAEEERQRITDLHVKHSEAERDLKKSQEELEKILYAIQLRLDKLEDTRKGNNWFSFR